MNHNGGLSWRAVAVLGSALIAVVVGAIYFGDSLRPAAMPALRAAPSPTEALFAVKPLEPRSQPLAAPAGRQIAVIIEEITTFIEENVTAAAAVIVVAGLLLLAFVPKWQVARLKASAASAKEVLELENRLRTTLAQIVGGLLLLTGLYYIARTVAVSEQGQITERFTRAIDQLGQRGDDNLAIRLGGIYALERIARDSARDHWPIMEVLTAFVRERAPWKEAAASELEGQKPKKAVAPGAPRMVSLSVKPKPDVQAALTVIGRRALTFGRGERERLNLADTDLRNAELGKAHLEGADLTNAHLDGANLIEAQLDGAGLRGAHLKHARLSEADLYGANLRDAQLQGAYLNGAHLESAYLVGANLGGAYLNSAHLEGAELSGANLEGAHLNGAHLERAWLNESHLKGAYLMGAHLKGAGLGRAHLESADLSGAHLKGVSLMGTYLEGANLTGAYLEGARFRSERPEFKGTYLEATGLTWEQIREAHTDDKTLLPTYLKPPEENLPGAAPRAGARGSSR